MFTEASSPVSDQFNPFPAPTRAPRLVDQAASADDRTYAMFMHLMLVIATFTVVPLVMGPLIMWLVKREESPFINDHGKEALNFNISTVLYYLAFIVLGFLTCGVTWYLGLPALWIATNVLSVIAAVSANRGEYYRYPACIRIVA